MTDAQLRTISEKYIAATHFDEDCETGISVGMMILMHSIGYVWNESKKTFEQEEAK